MRKSNFKGESDECNNVHLVKNTFVALIVYLALYSPLYKC